LSTRLGRFEFAEGAPCSSTKIGDMSLQMQVNSCAMLQERTFERVGSNRTMRCDVRITRRDSSRPGLRISAGRFRETCSIA